MPAHVMDVAPSHGVGDRRRRRGAYLIVGAVLGLAGLVLATAWFVHWRSDLSYFDGHGSEEYADRVAVGTSVYFGAAVIPRQHDRVVDVRALEPVISSNTSDATVRVLLCRGGEGIGVATSLKSECASVTPFRPGRYRFTLGPVDASGSRTSTAQKVLVVVAVTPTRPGRIYVAGVRIRYVDGIRHGEQQTGIDMAAATPRAKA